MTNGHDWNVGREMRMLPRGNLQKFADETESYEVTDGRIGWCLPANLTCKGCAVATWQLGRSGAGIAARVGRKERADEQRQ